MASLGDKNYKAVEDDSGFFFAGGLIPGSTQIVKSRAGAGGKAVDFYSGLKLDEPLNKNSKNYATVCREKTHNMEVGDVKELRQWERQILAECDEKYDPDDDSSDEEAIEIRKKRAENAAVKAAEEEALKPVKPGKK